MAGKIQRCWSQRLRAQSAAGNDEKRYGCEGHEGRSFLHGREVMPGNAALGKLFFEKNAGPEKASSPSPRLAAA